MLCRKDNKLIVSEEIVQVKAILGIDVPMPTFCLLKTGTNCAKKCE